MMLYLSLWVDFRTFKWKHHSQVVCLITFGAEKQHPRGNRLLTPLRKWGKGCRTRMLGTRGVSRWLKEDGRSLQFLSDLIKLQDIGVNC